MTDMYEHTGEDPHLSRESSSESLPDVKGERIRQMRLAAGMTQEELAGATGGLVTKQSISKYERGKAQPSPKVLTKLAEVFGVKAADLFRAPPAQIEFEAYRKFSRLGKRKQAQIEHHIGLKLEERLRLQDLLGQLYDHAVPSKMWTVRTGEDAERAAEELREKWELGRAPIADMTDVLEDHHVHVILLDTTDDFDGVSAYAYAPTAASMDTGSADTGSVGTKTAEERLSEEKASEEKVPVEKASEEKTLLAAAVVCHAGRPGERQRLSLAHELAHLVLSVEETEDFDEEKAAFRMGGAFLAPASSLLRDVGQRRRSISLQELLLLKHHYGISMQALLYRLKDLEVISENHYRQWFMHISKMGWRKQEPEELPAEEPKWLRRSTLRAYAEELISKEEAERLLGEEVKAGEGFMTLTRRRSFMKLSLEERQRILAEQAEEIKDDYASDDERADLQSGDIIEY